MGSSLSTNSIIAPFQDACTWNLDRVSSVLNAYKERDYDFGIDAGIVASLLEVSDDQAAALVEALSRGQNNIVNALSLICGLACLAEKDSIMLEERCSLIFDCFDFDDSGKISMDELTILFLSVGRVVNVILNIPEDPTDAKMEQFTITSYKLLDKKLGSSILKDEFMLWAKSNFAEISSLEEVAMKISEASPRSVSQVEGEIPAGYPQFTPAHRSYMSKVLTPELYAQLSTKTTSSGFTIDNVIQTGVDTPHLGVGCVALDEECFKVFKDLYDPVIECWHGFKTTDSHKVDLDVSHLVPNDGLDPAYIKSTRVRSGRSIRGLPLPPGCTRGSRREVERLITSALERMEGDLTGQYYPLGGMTPEKEEEMREDHFLFQKPGGGTLLDNAGAARDWPDARGIFHNHEKSFLVWVNEEDHMRVISMQQGADIIEVFDRWVRGVQAVEQALQAEGGSFMYDEHLGFLCTCPSNLGTGLRASMFVKLERLGEDPHKLEEICTSLGLQARGSAGEHSSAVGGWYDISNKARIGKSEVELVQTMIDGVSRLIEMEKAMEGGASIEEVTSGLPDVFVGPVIDPGDQPLPITEGPAPTFELPSDYPHFTPAHRSLMAKNLTPEIYSKYQDTVTSTGYTLRQAIQTGVDTPHLGVGITAGDEDSYEVFKDIFDPVIEGWHGFTPSDMHVTDLDVSHLVPNDGLDPAYIKSTRVRAGRSIRGLPLPPGTTREARREVEQAIVTGLMTLEGDLTGQYYPLGGMTPEQEEQMREDHFLFQMPGGGTLLKNASAARDWPDARGIFHNHDKNFLVWVNEEDHMRVISMQQGADIIEVFDRWVRGVSAVETCLKNFGHGFMHNEHLGFIGTCPSNLGTGLRASMFVKLERLGEDPHKLEEICTSLGLQARGSAGEHSSAVGGWYDISNKARIGKSEVELVQTMIDGVSRLIEMEKELEEERK